MASMTKGRNKTKHLNSSSTQNAPIKAGEVLYMGTICMLDTSGRALDGATAANCIGAGVVQPNGGMDRFDNTTGADGALRANFDEGIYGPFDISGGSIVAGDEGKAAWIVDNQTVHINSNSGARSPAGRIAYVESAGVFLHMSREIARQILEEAARADMVFKAATELTIASGAITVTQGAHTVDTESNAGSDDLDTISGGTAEELVVLRPESGSRTVVIKHGTGNIACPCGEDISLADPNDAALLRYANSVWTVLAFSTLVASGGGLGAKLASTATSKGASLVGVEDSATLLTATNVEAALAELVKKANAALGNPITVPVMLAAHSNGSVAARFTPGFAGKIRKFTASVWDPVVTAAKAATFTPAIGGVSVTGGALALVSADLGTVGAKKDATAITAANAFTASDEITVVASGVTAFVEGLVVFYLFLDPAA